MEFIVIFIILYESYLQLIIFDTRSRNKEKVIFYFQL